MEQKQLVSYFFIGLFLFILYQLTLILSPFFAAIFWAAILAFGFHPLYRHILKFKKVNRSSGALITTCLVLLIVVIPAAIIVISLLQEAVGLYQHISNAISEGKFEVVIEKFRQFLALEWVQRVRGTPGPIQENASDLVLEGAKLIGNFSTSQLATVTKNLFVGVFNFFLITILLFFFLRDGEHVHELFFSTLPLSKKNKNVLSQKINETFAAVIRGQFVTSIVQASLTGIAFWLLALPLPYFFGFAAFITSLIPVTGAATVWVPFVVYLFLVQEFGRAIALLLIGVFVISMSDNFLKPILIGEKTKLPIFLLFLGILGGLNLYGITGVFLGPVVLAVFFALLDIYRKDFQAQA